MADNNQTSGPTGTKDLGGVVNKDISFSKTSENIVFDSKNFRITTDDGGTLLARSTIKGNEEIVIPTTITQTNCNKNGIITFDLGTNSPYLVPLIGSTIKTDFYITNTVDNTSYNLFYDYFVEVPSNNNFPPGTEAFWVSYAYITSVIAYLNNNNTVQQSTIVIDPNYTHTASTVSFNYTCNCNIEFNFLSIFDITNTDSNGLTTIGYIGDPYCEHVNLRYSDTGILLDPSAQYNLIFDGYQAISPPWGTYASEYLNIFSVESEYNSWNGSIMAQDIGWIPPKSPTVYTGLNFLPVEMDDTIYDAALAQTILNTSNPSIIKIEDKFQSFGGLPEYLRNTAIVNDQSNSIVSGPFNLADYKAGTWNFDLSYYIGEVLGNIDLTVKIYIHLNRTANGAHNTNLVDTARILSSAINPTTGFPVVNEFPTIMNPDYVGSDVSFLGMDPGFQQNLFGFNNITIAPTYADLHTLVYSETFTGGSQNKLKSSNSSIQFNVTFASDLVDLGANIVPSISLFIEPTYKATGAHDDWSYQFFLDALEVKGASVSPITVPSITSNLVNTTTTISTPYPQDLLIGWCSLRDDLYLFFTNGKEDPDDSTTWSNPNGYTPSTRNEIWRFTYNKAGNYKNPSQYSSIFNFQLVHSNPDLNFTIHRPIANPGMIEARYENEDVQKIYWTDNYNVPRQINVAPSQAAITIGLTVQQLNLIPALTMELPYVTQIIDGGQLNAGVYQVIYRLKNLNLSETRFSRPSNSIPLFEASMGTSFDGFYPGVAGAPSTIDYPLSGSSLTGTPINSRKAIRVQINNVDTNYNEIEFVTVYYKNATDVPIIQIVKTETIPRNGKIDTYITGGESAPVPITLGESTAFTTAIRRCKTLAAKKQTLFLGNITIAGQDAEYDTRVYRFPINSTITTIYDSAGNNYTLNGSTTPPYMITHMNGNIVPTPYLVPETHDCIQDYNHQNPVSDQNLLYKYNSNVLGGSGPNLEYEFYTDTVLLDNKSVNTIADTSYAITSPANNSYVNFDSLATTPYHETGPGSFSNYSSPSRYSVSVGYRRDELYRFGIVFYDELDNPTYTNWIADIRMPHIWMPPTTANANALYASLGKRTRIGVDTYNNTFCSDTTYYNTTTKALYAKPLGLKVNIINTPPSAFTHGAVVRADRTPIDKYILGQGLIRPAFRLNPTNPHINNYVYLSCPDLGNTHGPDGAGVNDPVWYAWTLHSPEFLSFLDGDGSNSVESTIYPGYSPLDQIDWLGLLDDTSRSAPMWDDAPNGIKNTTGSARYDLNGGGTACTDNSSSVYFVARNVKNYGIIETATTPSTIKSPAANQLVKVNNGVPFGNLAGSSNKFVATVPGSPSKSVQAFTPLVYYGPGTNPSYDFGTRPASGQYESYNNRDSLYVGTTGSGLFVELDGGQSFANWAESGAGSNNFLAADNFWGTPMKNYLANYKRAVPSGVAYGGNTYFSRADTEYIFCNNLFKVNPSGTTSTIVYGGDTVVTLMHQVLDFFDTQFCRAENDPPGGTANNYSVLATCHVHTVQTMWKASVFPVETSIPVNYRRSALNNYSTTVQDSSIEVPSRLRYFSKSLNYRDTGSASYSWGNGARLEYHETFRIDSVFLYNFAKSIYRFFPKQPNAIIPNTYDCRIWKSEPKTSGEQVESWGMFKPSLYKDVESAYGPINNLIIFQDKMFYFQDRGFGIAQVDEQKVVQSADSTASDLVLGSSGILERYDYISTKTGTKHQFSMSVSDHSILWFDILARKIYRYKTPTTSGGGIEALSDIKGYNAFLYNNTAGTLQVSDNPYIYKGIHSTYDFRHNEFYMTFLDQPNELYHTLVYNDLLDGFVGDYTHYPKVYINDKVNIFSPKPNEPNQELFYIHNYGAYATFYDQTFPSSVSFILNTSPTTEKVLTNLEIVAEAYKLNTEQNPPYTYDAVAEIDYQDFFDTMRIYNNYQNTDWTNLITNELDYSSRNNYARRHKTLWNLRVPSDRVINVNSNIFSPINLYSSRPRLTRRLKDKWFMVELEHANTHNNKLVVHSAKPNFALNPR